MPDIDKSLFRNITVVLRIYLLVLILFATYRLILFIGETGRIGASASVGEIIYSFIIGLRFDAVIAGYILILPYLVISVEHLFDLNSKVLKTMVFYYIFLLFSLAFLVCAIDIPWFSHFFSRFSVSAFEWFDNPSFVFGMIFGEPRFWLYLIPFIALTVTFYFLLKKAFRHNFTPQKPARIPLKIGFSILFLCLIVLGIRGRLSTSSPIRVGTAFFCDDPFLNQLGLNPNFTLMTSFIESRMQENKTIKFMDDSIAIANVEKYFSIKNPSKDFPLLRKETFESTDSDKHNVVIIIMESMSAEKMKRHGNKDNLTPFLDSISNEGYYFDNTYSAGTRTYNGVFSTLCSFPAIYWRHPMKTYPMLKYHGIATALKKWDYSSVYFTTHDGQVDNIEGFLRFNDFDKIISEKDYPSEEVKTVLGVPDDYMFRYSIPVLNELNAKKKPFIAVLMTSSDHGPYYIPAYFKPKNSDIRNQSVEYADYSLKKFIQLCSGQKWFKNTIFVFVADHGACINMVYEIPLSFNHSPLIFYAPGIIKEKKVFHNMAGQIDIFPSIMGLLKLGYDNNTLGINLFKEKRPYIYFNSDDKIGVIDSTWLLVVHKDKSADLRSYRNNDLKNYAAEWPDIVLKMKTYAESNIQAYQYVIRSGKQ